VPAALPDAAAIERLLVLGGPSLVQEVAALFVAHGRERVAKIHDAWAAQDLLAVSTTAHSLGSSAAQLGLLSFSRLARRLEDAGRAGDVAGVAVGMTGLDDEFGRAVAALEALPRG
jgi:HPt (histidine-containing phosphotransfer) domain-containing protein